MRTQIAVVRELAIVWISYRNESKGSGKCLELQRRRRRPLQKKASTQLWFHMFLAKGGCP